jgi:hypothetical protein
MEKLIWELDVHADRTLSEINESQLKLTGKLYADLQTLTQVLGAASHPCFKEPGHSEADLAYFSAISYYFDMFSFRVLCIALSGCPTRMVKFNNCELTAEHLDMLLNAITSEHFPWLQIDWNPLPESKYSELLKEGTKLQLLCLRVCNISNEGFRMLCENLKTNKYLRTLDLYGNNISTLTPFTDVLDQNRFLVNFNIGKNYITDDNLKSIVGVFGKLEFPDDKVEEYRKKEKEIAKVKAQKNRGKVVEPEAPSDELIQEEETKQYYLLKNKVFRHLNLSFNALATAENLKALLNQCLNTFKVVISHNPIPTDTLESLQKLYPTSLVL